MIEGTRWCLVGMITLLCLSCASTGPSRYEQTDSATSGCLRNPACYTLPGNEAVLPWVGQAARAAATASATLRVLEAADVARIEYLLVECAKEANSQVNKREYGEGKIPDDDECNRVIGRRRGEAITRKVELGTMKHVLAFECVRREILRLFPDHVSIEPRYGPKASTGGYGLTNQWEGSMKPDIVLHAPGQPNQVQCVYDFKFPCVTKSKDNPFSASEVLQQLKDYKRLGGDCSPAIITPQLGISRE